MSYKSYKFYKSYKIYKSYMTYKIYMSYSHGSASSGFVCEL